MINYIDSYVSEIPTQLPQSAFYSAYYSFIVSAVLSRSFRSGINSALFAATASVIGSLMMPLLMHQFGDQEKKGYLSWKAITLIQMTGLGLAQLMLRSFSIYQTHFFASAFFTLLAIDVSMSHEGFHAKKKGSIFLFVT